MPSQLETAALRFRSQLLRQERQAASEMVRAYAAAWQRTRARLAELQEQIDAARASGLIPGPFTPRQPGGPVIEQTPGTFSLSWLYERDRLTSLLSQIEAELRRFAALAEELTEAGQLQAVRAAQANTAELVRQGAAAANAPEIVGMFDRLPTAAVQDLVGFAADGSPLRELFDALGPRVSLGVQDALVTAVATGIGPRETARLVRQQFGMGLARALTIARTEQIRAYREASRRSYAENADLLDGWVWLSAHDGRTCPSCWAMHGSRHPVTETLDGHPNCIVDGTVVNSPQILATSKRWFDGEVIEITTVNGNVLTVTKNHPILTDKGWIAAHLVTKGSNIISSVNGQRTVALVDPNHDSRPSLIQDIVKSFDGALGVSSVSMPTTAEDFHGDGWGGNANVNIVGADGFLQYRLNSPILQVFSQNAFGVGGVGFGALLADGAFRQVGFTSLHSPDGFLRDGNASVMFFDGSLRSQQLISLGLAADGNTHFGKAQAHNVSADSVIERYGVLGFAANISPYNFLDWQVDFLPNAWYTQLLQSAVEGGFSDSVPFQNKADRDAAGVFLDSVVNVRFKDFAGHVYNLQTSTGWYIANGIITHNCRCTMVPIVKGHDPNIPTGEELFKELPAAEQQKILGKAAHLAYQNGAVTLSDFVGRRDDPAWGTMRYARSLTEILGRKEARQYIDLVLQAARERKATREKQQSS